MIRTTKVQMALEDAYDWDDGTLEDYVNQVEAERDALKRRVEAAWNAGFQAGMDAMGEDSMSGRPTYFEEWLKEEEKR